MGTVGTRYVCLPQLDADIDSGVLRDRSNCKVASRGPICHRFRPQSRHVNLLF